MLSEAVAEMVTVVRRGTVELSAGLVIAAAGASWSRTVTARGAETVALFEVSTARAVSV